MGADNLLLEDADFLYDNDLEGNRIRRTNKLTGDYVTYGWDHRNRLTAVAFYDDEDVLQKRVEFDYDVFNRRIAKRVDADGDEDFDSAQKFVYDGEDIVLVYDDASSLTSRYLHGPGIDEIFADERFVASLLDDVYYPLPDNQGTVRDLAKYDAILEETEIAKHVEFNSFGEIVGDTAPSLPLLYSYTGREWDPDVEAFYYRARWYDPKTMRMLSKDPIGFLAGDANPQRYAGNNVTNATDPSGLIALLLPGQPAWNNLPAQRPTFWQGAGNMIRSRVVGFAGRTIANRALSAGSGLLFENSQPTSGTSAAPNVPPAAPASATSGPYGLVPNTFGIGAAGSIGLIVGGSVSSQVTISFPSYDPLEWRVGIMAYGGGQAGVVAGGQLGLMVTASNALSPEELSGRSNTIAVGGGEGIVGEISASNLTTLGMDNLMGDTPTAVNVFVGGGFGEPVSGTVGYGETFAGSISPNDVGALVGGIVPTAGSQDLWDIVFGWDGIF